MGYLTTDKKKITAKTLLEMKAAGEKITQMTAYDFTTAGIIDAAGIDSILVGDSASNVMAGNQDTTPITVDQMIYHARAVVRACHHCLVVCDMPFGSYQVSREDGIRNAIRIIKETGAGAVKMEGGKEIADTVKGIVDAGIPVIGHLGLTPQSIHKFGGYGLRAKEDTEAEKLIEDALALDAAGVSGITLEIGAGNGTDGQVLVYADALGMTSGFKPKFLRHFANVNKCMTEGVMEYIRCVKSESFPSEAESY